MYVNGNLAGIHKGGYARFRYPVTDKIKIGSDNVIAVKVSNAHNNDIPPLSGDFTFFGGIYRDVTLLATEKLQFAALDFAGLGVYIDQSDVSSTSANIKITSKIFNNNATAKEVVARVIITDHTGAIVKETTATQNVAANTGYSFVQNTTISNSHL